MDFEAFLNAAWSDHASDAEAVAERLTQSTAMLQETAQIPRYAQLGAHVFGEHFDHADPTSIFARNPRGAPFGLLSAT